MNQLPRAMREAMFVERAYSLIYPFSDGFESAEITHLQAVNDIRKQLDVLCARGMTAVLVVISSALGLRPSEDDDHTTLCLKLKNKLNTAKNILELDERGYRNFPEGPVSPRMGRLPSPQMGRLPPVDIGSPDFTRLPPINITRK